MNLAHPQADGTAAGLPRPTGPAGSAGLAGPVDSAGRAAPAGPVDPTPDALAALTPLGLRDVRLDPAGLLGSWQVRNAAATLPHCVERLDSSGALENLRRAGDRGPEQPWAGDPAAQASGPGNDDGAPGRGFTGMWFADSDVHKTLEAAAWELGRAPDDQERSLELGEFIARTTRLLALAQDPDGYLNSYFTLVRPEARWRELVWSHELYCAGHLLQAAVAATRAGAGDEVMAVARRLADLIVDRFGPAGEEAVCGHPEIETALVELYRATGHRPYLDLATRFVDRRGRGLLPPGRFGSRYHQDHQPVRESDEVTGHAVRQLYLLAGVVDVAVETRDTALLAAAERLWDNAFTAKTYVTGGHGSRHRDEAFGDPHELPPDRAYAETCAAVASVHWNWRLLLATGRSRYADELERALYNAVAGSTALDGRHFFYSNPLQLRTGHDGSDEDAPSQRLDWYACACCPPNLARLMASLQAYVATTDAGGIQIHLYSAGTIRATVRGAQLGVTVATGYPWNGAVTLTVSGEAVEPWTLALRVPGWCRQVTVTVDGVPKQARVDGGYLRIERRWTDGAAVRVNFAMPPRLVAAHPHVDAVRGCVALARGPLVYCLEQTDLPPGTLIEDVVLDLSAPLGAVDEVLDPAAGTAAGQAGIVTLTARGSLTPPPSTELYVAHPPETDDQPDRASGTELRAVPYFLWANRAPGALRVWVPGRS